MKSIIITITVALGSCGGAAATQPAVRIGRPLLLTVARSVDDFGNDGVDVQPPTQWDVDMHDISSWVAVQGLCDQVGGTLTDDDVCHDIDY